MIRRTPKLTKLARGLFLEAVESRGGWTPGSTVALIAEATALTQSQVRDAIFGVSADEWRRSLTVGNNAGST